MSLTVMAVVIFLGVTLVLDLVSGWFFDETDYTQQV